MAAEGKRWAFAGRASSTVQGMSRTASRRTSRSARRSADEEPEANEAAASKGAQGVVHGPQSAGAREGQARWMGCQACGRSFALKARRPLKSIQRRAATAAPRAARAPPLRRAAPAPSSRTAGPPPPRRAWPRPPSAPWRRWEPRGSRTRCCSSQPWRAKTGAAERKAHHLAVQLSPRRRGAPRRRRKATPGRGSPWAPSAARRASVPAADPPRGAWGAPGGCSSSGPIRAHGDAPGPRSPQLLAQACGWSAASPPSAAAPTSAARRWAAPPPGPAVSEALLGGEEADAPALGARRRLEAGDHLGEVLRPGDGRARDHPGSARVHVGDTGLPLLVEPVAKPRLEHLKGGGSSSRAASAAGAPACALPGNPARAQGTARAKAPQGANFDGWWTFAPGACAGVAAVSHTGSLPFPRSE